MKKMLLTAVILSGCFLVAQAQEVANTAQPSKVTAAQPADLPAVVPAPAAKSPVQADTFQLGFYFDIPPETAYTDCHGIKVGAPICGGTGTVWGLETSVFASGTDNVNGVQCSVLVDKSKKVTGLQASIFNYSEKVDGLQFGVFNMAKDSAFQFGIINYIEGSSIPVLPVFNVRF